MATTPEPSSVQYTPPPYNSKYSRFNMPGFGKHSYDPVSTELSEKYTTPVPPVAGAPFAADELARNRRSPGLFGYLLGPQFQQDLNTPSMAHPGPPEFERHDSITNPPELNPLFYPALRLQRQNSTSTPDLSKPTNTSGVQLIEPGNMSASAVGTEGLFSSAGKPYKRSSTSLHSDAEDSDSGFQSDRGLLNNNLSTSSLRKAPTAHGDLQSYRQLSTEGNMTANEAKDDTLRKSPGGTAWLPGSSIASVALPESKVLEPSAGGPAGDIIERSRNVLSTAHKPTAHRRWNSTESATPQTEASTRQPYPTGLKGFFSRPIKLTPNEINLLSIQK